MERREASCVPQLLKRRRDLSPPDPARRRRPSSAGAVTPRTDRPWVGAWERRAAGACGSGCLVGLVAWGGGFLFVFEKLVQRERKGFWLFRSVVFSPCVVVSFVSLESRPRLLFQAEYSPLYLGNLPAGKKNANLGGFFSPFLSFLKK